MNGDWQAGVSPEETRDVIERRVELSNVLGPKDIEWLVSHNVGQRFADVWKILEMSPYDLRVVARDV